MTQVSKYPLRKEIETRMYEVFLDSIGMVKNRSQVSHLVDDLLSPTEKTMLAKRLSIALLLQKNYNQRAISKILHVSLTTVNKISRYVHSGSGGYRMVIDPLLKQEKYEEFLQKIDDVLAEIFPPHRNWSQWRRERWEEKMRNKKAF